MSDHFYKEILYPVQDKALELIGSVSSPFYLTGGTALSRFMLNHRYSDDLDFFLNRHSDFNIESDRLIYALGSGFESVEVQNRQDSYVRVLIHDKSVDLKIELVNDVGFRVGEPNLTDKNFKIDTWQNILSNKLSALQRNAGKDFVDVFFISRNYYFNWETIIGYAKQKDAWITEISISEFLLEFDFIKLQDVKFPSEFKIESITRDIFKTLARESLHGFDNSLYGKKL
jgi:hypothetical protein